MVKIVSTIGANSVNVASLAEAELFQATLGKYGIKVGVQAGVQVGVQAVSSTK